MDARQEAGDQRPDPLRGVTGKTEGGERDRPVRSPGGRTGSAPMLMPNPDRDPGGLAVACDWRQHAPELAPADQEIVRPLQADSNAGQQLLDRRREAHAHGHRQASEAPRTGSHASQVA